MDKQNFLFKLEKKLTKLTEHHFYKLIKTMNKEYTLRMILPSRNQPKESKKQKSTINIVSQYKNLQIFIEHAQIPISEKIKTPCKILTACL
jgi:hypothetical protein